MNDNKKLSRTIGLSYLIFYGVGTMIGAGFYALMGKVAGAAGMFAPIAFFTSAMLALISGFSFAELSSRFPVSAGESKYVYEGFQQNWLAAAVGWLVITTGVVSAATIVTAFVGFLQDLVYVPDPIIIIGLVTLLAGIAIWGISQSVKFANIITVLTLAGLLYVVVLTGTNLANIPNRLNELTPTFSLGDWKTIFAGAFIGFYAFIGFEDLVNNAEEIKNVERNLPIAIFASVGITLFFYILVTLVSVLTVAPSELANSDTPLALVVKGKGWFSKIGIGIISLIAGVNGALAQIIMASRVSYGMAKSSRAPSWFAFVSSKTQTPVYATLVMATIVLLLALFLPLVTLAKMTSSVILVVFTMINLSLWRIKRANPDKDGKGPRWPIWLPIVGAAVSLIALVFQLILTLSGAS
jgi:amino acid transporter